MNEYQLCPKCNGQGKVSKPPYIAGDVFEWTSAESIFECDVCYGKKIISRPDDKAGELVEALMKIEQMSDPGSYARAVTDMKSIATTALNNYKK